MEAGLTDDRNVGGGVSWQGLLERGGRVARWEAEPGRGSGCCGQCPHTVLEGQFYCSGCCWYAECGGGNASNPFLPLLS
jgi:hypothetical protein